MIKIADGRDTAAFVGSALVVPARLLPGFRAGEIANHTDNRHQFAVHFELRGRFTKHAPTTATNSRRIL